MDKENNTKMKDIAVITTTLVLILGLAIFAWLKPANAYSDSERRYLDQAPEVTVQSVIDGSFMKKFEGYTVDQFPARDTFRQLKSITAIYGFGQKDIHDIYSYEGYLSKMEYPMDEDSLERAVKVFKGIYDKYLAETDAKVYFSIIPDKNCFMAEESGHLSMDYEALYEYMKAHTSYMEYIEIASLLELEDYYKTDSHWRQDKITDVAKKILIGMNPLESNRNTEDSVTKSAVSESTASENSVLESSVSKVILDLSDAKSSGNKDSQSDISYEIKTLDHTFYGVYAGQSGLPVEGEDLYYLEHEMFQFCEVFDYENNKEIAVYDMEKARGKDPYEIFLSGPLSLVTIENPNAETKKELVIFRDSFGSALAPLLVEQYAKITLVDIRYMSSTLLERWITFENQDVLFLYSTQVLNNSETMK